MNAHTTFPVIATSKVFDDYLVAARKNLDALVRLAAGLNDREAEREAQFILDNFDDASVGLNELITSANEPRGTDAEQFWRESRHAVDAGLAA